MTDEHRDGQSLKDALREARTQMATQHRVARRTMRVSLSFRVIAYAIGVALLLRPVGFSAPTWVAVTFGFALIVTTFLSQHFRPDVKFINAKGRFLQLKRAVTTGEAGLQLIEDGAITDAEIPELVSGVRRAVDQIERAQHLDYAMMRQRIVSSMPVDPASDTGE